MRSRYIRLAFPAALVSYRVFFLASLLAAHEFFHPSQWMYQQACSQFNLLQVTWTWNNNEDLRWWMEATAQWAQHEAISPDANYADEDTSYVAGIPDHVNHPWTHIDIRPPQGGTNIPYSVLLPFYLVEKLQPGQNNEAIIRNTWEEYEQSGNCNAMKPILNTVLHAQNPATSIEQLYPNYIEKNYFVDYANQATFRTVLPADLLGRPYRPQHEEPLLNDQATIVQGPAPSFNGRNVDWLASAYVEFQNGFNPPTGRSLMLDLDMYIYHDNSVLPAVKVWGISQYSPSFVYTPYLPNVRFVDSNGFSYHYTASIMIPNFDSYKWVAMAVVDPHTTGLIGSPMTYNYTARVMQPTPTQTATPTFTATSTPTSMSTRTSTPTNTPTP